MVSMPEPQRLARPAGHRGQQGTQPGTPAATEVRRLFLMLSRPGGGREPHFAFNFGQCHAGAGFGVAQCLNRPPHRCAAPALNFLGFDFTVLCRNAAFPNEAARPAGTCSLRSAAQPAAAICHHLRRRSLARAHLRARGRPQEAWAPWTAALLHRPTNHAPGRTPASGPSASYRWGILPPSAEGLREPPPSCCLQRFRSGHVLVSAPLAWALNCCYAWTPLRRPTVIFGPSWPPRPALGQLGVARAQLDASLATQTNSTLENPDQRRAQLRRLRRHGGRAFSLNKAGLTRPWETYHKMAAMLTQRR